MHPCEIEVRRTRSGKNWEVRCHTHYWESYLLLDIKDKIIRSHTDQYKEKCTLQ